MSDEREYLEHKVLEAVPYLIEFWQAYLDSASVEPTEAQIQAGFVELIDKDSSFRMGIALGAIEPYERILLDYTRQLGQ